MSDEIDPGELRISDLDRERVSALLGTALQQGRITPVEFTDRCAAAWAARTRAELLAVLSDLPGGPPAELAPLVLDVPLGQVRRTGDWAVPELIRLVGTGQRTVLDFTDAVIRRPEVVVEVTGNLSSTRVILPADARVDTDGLELIAGRVRHRWLRGGRGNRAGSAGERRRWLRGRKWVPDSVIPTRFVLRGRATLCTVTVWQPRPPRRR